jgi:hypothetical protein
MLLANDLEVALLEALEIKPDVASKEVQTVLNRFNFTDHQLYNF